MKHTSIAAAGLAALLALTSCSSSSSGGASTSPTTAPSHSAAGGSGGGGGGGGGGYPKPGASSTVSSAPAASAAEITIKNFAFAGTMTVKPGEKVTVVNQDSTAHTLTDKATHKFNTGNIAASGGTGTVTAPTKAGTYPFGCNYHPQMAGTLIVHA